MNKNRINELVGAEIKARRTQLGMTQVELGEKIGVGEMTIYFYERGSRKMNVDTYFEICRILHIDPTELMKKVMEQL